MSVVALSHGYPPLWNMGGEVALHRAMAAIRSDKFVLTATDEPYEFEGVGVRKINIPNVLDIASDPKPIAKQLVELNATSVIGQNELSMPAVLAAEILGIPSVVNVHTPPQYGGGIKSAMRAADFAVYNTQTAATEWGEPKALVLHPPISAIPDKISNKGDAYTLLSSLKNKGVEVVIELAKRYPEKRFIIVRSPAEPTHGLANIEEIVKDTPNIELHPRVAPEDVHKYFKQTRILLVPSRYETYGMSAIEAAGYGIPSVHVDTPHVREGIGEAAILVPPLDVDATAMGIDKIESNYKYYSTNARIRAEWLQERQAKELQRFADFMEDIKKPVDNRNRKRAVVLAAKRNRY